MLQWNLYSYITLVLSDLGAGRERWGKEEDKSKNLQMNMNAMDQLTMYFSRRIEIPILQNVRMVLNAIERLFYMFHLI